MEGILLPCLFSVMGSHARTFHYFLSFITLLLEVVYCVKSCFWDLLADHNANLYLSTDDQAFFLWLDHTYIVIVLLVMVKCNLKRIG